MTYKWSSILHVRTKSGVISQKIVKRYWKSFYNEILSYIEFFFIFAFQCQELHELNTDEQLLGFRLNAMKDPQIKFQSFEILLNLIIIYWK